MFSETDNMVHPDPNFSSSSGASSMDAYTRNSSFSSYDGNQLSGECSPILMSPWNQPVSFPSNLGMDCTKSMSQSQPQNPMIGSIERKEGHIYSLAARDNFLYTGSDSKNIRVWKSLQEFSAFKSNSGLVKTIVVSGNKIFTGHQDGKIRVWKVSNKDAGIHVRIGNMPTFFDIFIASMKPSNYVEVKRNRTAVWIKHTDAISCLSMDEEKGLLYSGSWDRTFKVWKVKGYKCMESVRAHDDAVNSVIATVSGIVYTASADGTVKAWKREHKGKSVKHRLTHTLLSQEAAVTALAVNGQGTIVYAGSSDGLVNFWELEKQLSHGGVMKGHKLAVLCLAAAGNMLFSGSADKTICIWRRDQGAGHICMSVLTGHTGPVKCLTVEEDKTAVDGDKKWVVYSGSLDKSVKVWSVSEMVPEL